MFAIILLFALTRAEIIERFRAGSVVQADGLVQVWADCGSAMRREYQLPVGAFVGDVCKTLYRAENLRPVKFDEPGIVIHIGDGTTNLTNVVTRTVRSASGRDQFRMYLPAPGHSDRQAVRLGAVKGFYLAVRNETIDDAEALRRLRAAYPELKLADDYAALDDWLAGRRGAEDDEKFLKLRRSVLNPGHAAPEDVRVFASHLHLYPPQYDLCFAGGLDAVSFRKAITLAKTDPRVRYAAYLKLPEPLALGGGRGVKMAAAAAAYTDFLKALYEATESEEEMNARLDAAEELLKGVNE